MEAVDARYHGQAEKVYPSLPASPTLTNPDMILPEYERARSPLAGTEARDHSPLMMWKHSYTAAHAAGPMTPLTPIIYGNGTMLSDIGEVTEVESTPGKHAPSRTRNPAVPSAQEPGLPALFRDEMSKKRSRQNLAMQRDRRCSIESTSTITAQSQGALYADFDDTLSVGDSVFQGDDEDSLASSADDPPALSSLLDLPSHDKMERMSTHSTVSIGQRAEEILANAKMRLTTMEGNLTRARSTLVDTSFGSNGSTPSPPLRRPSTSLHAHDCSGPFNHAPGHGQISSNFAVQHGLPHWSSAPRSQSALGAAGGYRKPLMGSNSFEQLGYTTEPRSSTYSHGLDPGDRNLDVVTEDEHETMAASEEEADLESGMGQFFSPTFGDTRAFDPTWTGEPRLMGARTKTVVRSASASQMRDLQHQMKGLQGKISNLRQQARADSIRRRSLRSLRTPSPFTHAHDGPWIAGFKPAHPVEESIREADSEESPWNGEEWYADGELLEDYSIDLDKDVVEDDGSCYSEGENVTALMSGTQRAARTTGGLPAPADAHLRPESGGDAAFGEADGDALLETLPPGFLQPVVDLGYGSESGESLYHDTFQHPVSHEDREDAFDYEHFFLHSAMGTISQQRRLGRRDSGTSFDSNASAETAKGPLFASSTPESPSVGNSTGWAVRARRSSDTSVSSAESFATANEGRLGRVESRTAVDAEKMGFGSSCLDADEKPDSFGTIVQSQMTGLTTRSSIEFIAEGSIASDTAGSNSTDSTYRSMKIPRPSSSSAAASLHRPSVSSFESAGTNRSFPLVNKVKSADSLDVVSPASSPGVELQRIPENFLTEGAVASEGQRRHGEGPGANEDGHEPKVTVPAIQALPREDQFLVERLVAGLGRCVLGLTESGTASAESIMYRRLIDGARRVLEGLETVD